VFFGWKKLQNQVKRGRKKIWSDIEMEGKTRFYRTRVKNKYKLCEAVATAALHDFMCDDANRMRQVTRDGVVAMSYLYNGKGEQVYKTGSSKTITTVYDEAGHWIGDYDANEQPVQQAIWLDDLPVGLLVGAGVNQKLYYIEADALGTPRVVIDPDRNVAVWNWSLANEAFGDGAPNEDPDADGIGFVFDMRMPGQRWDSATGMSQNGFRDYDAATGRYAQSDPVGLGGGISTYGYVGGNSFLFADTFGLDVDINLFPEGSGAYRAAKRYVNDPNECTVGGHGSPLRVGDLSAKDLAARIANTPACQNKPIRLIACNSGVSPRRGTWSFGQYLANATGQNVYAPDNWGWLHGDGRFEVAPTIHKLPWTAGDSDAQDDGPDFSRLGRFNSFTPRINGYF
jgi:RHS repeat-associated protein